MKLPRVRFTVGRLMIAVAVVALLIGGPIEVARLRRLGDEYAGRARAFERRAIRFRSGAGLSRSAWEAACEEVERLNRDQTWMRYARPLPPGVCGRLAEHFEAMKSKYERAARYAWWPVGPDPPDPQ